MELISFYRYCFTTNGIAPKEQMHFLAEHESLFMLHIIMFQPIMPDSIICCFDVKPIGFNLVLLL